MANSIKEFDLNVWHSGLRSEQSESRRRLRILDIQGNKFKFLPILDQSDLDVANYIAKFKLSYHPLYYKGCVSVGDIHSSKPIKKGMNAEQSRFNGTFRECGLHEDSANKVSSKDLSAYFINKNEQIK